MHDPHSNAPARKCRDQLAEPFPPTISIWAWMVDLVRAISRFWLPALSSRTTATAAEANGNGDDAAAAAAVARDKGHLDQNSTGRYRDALLLSQIHHIIPLSNSLEQSVVALNPATQPLPRLIGAKIIRIIAVQISEYSPLMVLSLVPRLRS